MHLRRFALTLRVLATYKFVQHLRWRSGREGGTRMRARDAISRSRACRRSAQSGDDHRSPCLVTCGMAAVSSSIHRRALGRRCASCSVTSTTYARADAVDGRSRPGDGRPRRARPARRAARRACDRGGAGARRADAPLLLLERADDVAIDALAAAAAPGRVPAEALRRATRSARRCARCSTPGRREASPPDAADAPTPSRVPVPLARGRARRAARARGRRSCAAARRAGTGALGRRARAARAPRLARTVHDASTRRYSRRAMRRARALRRPPTASGRSSSRPRPGDARRAARSSSAAATTPTAMRRRGSSASAQRATSASSRRAGAFSPELAYAAHHAPDRADAASRTRAPTCRRWSTMLTRETRASACGSSRCVFAAALARLRRLSLVRQRRRARGGADAYARGASAGGGRRRDLVFLPEATARRGAATRRTRRVAGAAVARADAPRRAPNLEVLLGELAHELRNPMVTIKTFAQHLDSVLGRSGGARRASRRSPTDAIGAHGRAARDAARLRALPRPGAAADRRSARSSTARSTSTPTSSARRHVDVERNGAAVGTGRRPTRRRCCSRCAACVAGWSRDLVAAHAARDARRASRASLEIQRADRAVDGGAARGWVDAARRRPRRDAAARRGRSRRRCCERNGGALTVHAGSTRTTTVIRVEWTRRAR